MKVKENSSVALNIHTVGMVTKYILFVLSLIQQ